MQGDLFGNAVAVKKPAPAISSRYEREYKFQRKPTVQHGIPDKSGKYWYQRFHDDMMKMDAPARDILLLIILDWPYTRLDNVRIMLDRFHRTTVQEQDNFKEAMGY